MSNDPLAFTTSLELLNNDLDRIEEDLTLTVSDTNQLWFVLPNGVLPFKPDVDISVPYLRFTAEGRRDCMLTRSLFMKNSGTIADTLSSEKFLIEFRPCVLVGRTKEGKAFSRRADGIDTSGAAPEPPKTAPPAAASAGDGTTVPDIGELLNGLQETRKSISTIDTLLTDPDALLTVDEEKRQELMSKVAETKDQVLVGLGRLGELLSKWQDYPVEKWRHNVSKAISHTIEAMMSFEGMSDKIKEDKRRELESLRRSIESYFATIDPQVDSDSCRKFSAGMNQILLEERKSNLIVKQTSLTRDIATSYDFIIGALQDFMPKGASLAFIPFPYVEPAQSFKARVVLNMVHIVMAVRYGGLSIRLETEGFARMHNELRGFDHDRPPRLHICDRSRYASMRAANSRKVGRRG